jgi:hypothetical protein
VNKVRPDAHCSSKLTRKTPTELAGPNAEDSFEKELRAMQCMHCDSIKKAVKRRDAEEKYIDRTRAGDGDVYGGWCKR